MTEERCPYCNGTGLLPVLVVARYEQRRDEYAGRLLMIQRLWAALANLYAGASPASKRQRENLTVEGLRMSIAAAYRRFPELKAEYRAGPDPHA